jgi:hypothetical protein
VLAAIDGIAKVIVVVVVIVSVAAAEASSCSFVHVLRFSGSDDKGRYSGDAEVVGVIRLYDESALPYFLFQPLLKCWALLEAVITPLTGEEGTHWVVVLLHIAAMVSLKNLESTFGGVIREVVPQL